MPKVEVHFGNSDKLYHIIAYFSLAFFWLFTFYKKPSLKYFVIIACIIYGIIIEYLQSTITVYRTGDFRDAIANTIGILLGLIVFTQILKKIKVNS
ncbi:VanZ family protein [uncultured Polaribacter sp.]|uniref:VanZ family protein n=1 Tax=uncultured Polaribacter sp. TaxID=174711 RepID=UPI0026202A50|nr:VanZ family protein [uncultured Polaribacter sp.]